MVTNLRVQSDYVPQPEDGYVDMFAAAVTHAQRDIRRVDRLEAMGKRLSPAQLQLRESAIQFLAEMEQAATGRLE